MAAGEAVTTASSERLEKRKAQLALEAQISAKVPILWGGTW
jgi:hypothetical protein